VSQDERTFYIQWRGPDPADFGPVGLVVRFVVSVAALWFSQWIITGFDIESAWALIVGAIIFGLVNAFIRPIVAFVSCPLTILTLGFFILIVNALMLVLTEWIAGWFDLAFEVDGFWAAFLGALVISIVSTLLNWFARRNVLEPIERERSGEW
jgi:putative membrane protein